MNISSEAVLLVDLDDTLLDYKTEEQFGEDAVRQLISVDYAAWVGVYRHVKDLARAKYPHSNEAIKFRFVELIQNLGLDYSEQLLENILDVYLSARYDSVRVFEDVPAFLKRFAQHKTILCTSGSFSVQMQRLKIAGLWEKFDAVRVSGQVGCGKDEWPRFLGQYWCPSSTYVVISDQRRPDLDMAAVLGFDTVHLDRRCPLSSDFCEGTHVHSLDQVLLEVDNTTTIGS